MNIVVIGTGNTATLLAKKFKAAGHTILQVYGRDTTAASELAYELDSESTNYWNVVNKSADFYLIAVSDIAIEEVLQELQLPANAIVAHTAAAVGKKVFEGRVQRYGVLYPLQSLRKEAGYLPEMPVLVDAGDTATLETIRQLAQSIGVTVVHAGDEERLKLHLAAVFCNNFVNHLLVLAELYCRREGIDFALMQPLIKETARRLDVLSPSASQTGPALRNDMPTLEKHRSLLSEHPDLLTVYDLLTKSIQDHREGF